MIDERTITTDDLRVRLDQRKNPDFWNVQPDKWFTGEVIPGSRRLPLDTIEHNIEGVPKDAEPSLREPAPAACRSRGRRRTQESRALRARGPPRHHQPTGSRPAVER